MNAIIDRALHLMRGIVGLHTTITWLDTRVATLELIWEDSMSEHDQIRGARAAQRAIRKAGIRCHNLCETSDTVENYSQLRLLAPRRGSRVTHAERYAITATQEQLDTSVERKLQRTGPRHGQRLAQEMRLISAGGHGRKLAAARNIVAAQERNIRDMLDDQRGIARRTAVKAGLRAQGVL